MKRSTSRILTTHVGSLIRPDTLQDFLRARQGGKTVDQRAYDKCLTDSVAAVVRRQAEAGIDVVSDGEFGKSISWSQYVIERLSGFERRPIKPGANPFARGADRTRFAEFYAELDARETPATVSESICVGPIAYTGQAALQRDIDNFTAALGEVKVEEGFLPVAAPASVIPDRKNEYYKSDEECLQAIADAMRTEYRMIVEAGFILQLDDARTAVTYDRMVPPASFQDYRTWVARHVEILNHHVNFDDDHDYLDAVVQTFSHAKPQVGWSAHAFGRCDVATLQRKYDLPLMTTAYSTCLDLATGAGIGASSTLIAYNSSVTLTATLGSSCLAWSPNFASASRPRDCWIVADASR